MTTLLVEYQDEFGDSGVRSRGTRGGVASSVRHTLEDRAFRFRAHGRVSALFMQPHIQP